MGRGKRCRLIVRKSIGVWRPSAWSWRNKHPTYKSAQLSSSCPRGGLNKPNCSSGLWNGLCGIGQFQTAIGDRLRTLFQMPPHCLALLSQLDRGQEVTSRCSPSVRRWSIATAEAPRAGLQHPRLTHEECFPLAAQSQIGKLASFARCGFAARWPRPVAPSTPPPTGTLSQTLSHQSACRALEPRGRHKSRCVPRKAKKVAAAADPTAVYRHAR